MSTNQNLPSLLWLRRFWPILALALLPVIPLWRTVFLGESIGPFDQIRQMAPWHGPKPAQPWDVLQADGVLQFYVWRDLVFGAWSRGQLPFWNPYQLAGTPLLANSQSGALYPPHVLMGILHVTTGLAMILLAWGHLFWAGFGTYFLCRALGARRLGAFIGGASFSLSSFMIAWTGLPSVIETVSWIPWVLAFTVFLFTENPLLVRLKFATASLALEESIGQTLAREGSLRKRYAFSTLGLAISIGMMILAGHLQFVAYGGMATVLLVLWLLATRRNPLLEGAVTVRRMRSSGGVVASSEEGRAGQAPSGFTKLLLNPNLTSLARVLWATILGVCIAAPQLLPVLQYGQYSHRKNSPSEAGYEAYVGGSIQPYELIKMLVPSIQGNPRQMASDQLPISTYYPAVLRPGANFAESAIGVGVFSLILLCLLPMFAKKREPVWGVVALGAVGFLLAIGSPLDRLMYFAVPGWSSTGSPGRAICLFVLAVSVAAGVSASRLPDLRAILKERPVFLSIASGIFCLIALVCALFKNSYDLRTGLNAEIIDNLKSLAESASLPSALGVILLSLLALFLASKEQSVRSHVLLAAVPIISCLAFFGTILVQTGIPNLAVKNSVGKGRIAPINGAWDLFQAVEATLPPNLSALNRIHSLDGYDSLVHRESVDVLRQIDGKDPAAEANGNMMLIKPGANWKKLADAGVTEVWSRDAIPQLEGGTQSDGLYRYPLNGPGRASTPAGPAEIVGESLSQIRLNATGPGKLVVRDRNMPGWMAKVDGKHVALGGGTWMEVDLSKGPHQVELNYVPPGFRTGIVLAALAWFIVVLAALGAILTAREFTKQAQAIGSSPPLGSK